MSDIDPRSLREELEIRVVALLSGELPEVDADELEKILSIDEELSNFRDRMAVLIGDVHAAREEVVLPPASQNMRLSEERRREIFGDADDLVFEPKEKVKKWWHLGLLEIAAMILCGGFLAAILIPSVGAVRKSASKDNQHRADEANFEAPAQEEYFALQTEIPQERIEGTPQPMIIPSTTPPDRLIPRRRVLEGRERDELASGDYSGLAMTESEMPVPEMAPMEENSLLVKQQKGYGIPEDSYRSFGYESDAEEAVTIVPTREFSKSEMQRKSSEMAIDQIETNSFFDFNEQTEDEGMASLDRDDLKKSEIPLVGRLFRSEGLTAYAQSQLRDYGLGLSGYANASKADMGGADDPFAGSDDISITGGTPSSFLTGKSASGPVDAFAAPASQNVSRPSKIVSAKPTSGMTGYRENALSASAPVDPFAASSSFEADSKALLSRGRKQYLNGDYDGATASFDAVAAQDSGNAEAKLFQTKIAELRGNIHKQNSYKTREEMLVEVDQSWERPKVFDVDDASRVSADMAPSTESRLRSIVIPQVNLSDMPLSKVLETLSELSLEYDTIDRTGVRLDYAPINGVDPQVNFSLRNLSLDRILEFVTQQVDHEFIVTGDRIQVQAKGQSAAEQMAEARLKNTSQTPKAEKQTTDAPVSTFSLNVSDVSFKLAEAALATQRIPSAELIRTEEFVNSFNYGDPAPREDEPVTLNWEIAQHPYQHNRQIVRFSLQTQAAGRAANQPLNLNLLVDNSGSMQRPDRRAILEKSLESLQTKLTDQDQLNIILFARQPRLIANASTVISQQAAIHDALNYQPEGGTNLEAGLHAAYENAQAHYDPRASNRVILMTDGAANLGDVDASALAQTVIDQRKQGIALDAYGIGWEDYNDAMLEEITRNGDGRYAFLNSVDTAASDFAEKLAGTLRVAAADVKVQILWNPERVTAYRQIGYDLHQLREQDFRDNTVDAAEIGEAESGTALYVLQINDDPNVVGGLGKLQVRYRVPATGEYIERAWPLEMPRKIAALQDAPSSLRLAATSALFAERLANNPYAANYSFEDLNALTSGLPEAFPTQPRVVALQNMIQSAQSLFSSFE